MGSRKRNGVKGRPRRPLPILPEGVSPNPFARWLARVGRHPRDVAAILDVSRTTVYELRRGVLKPGRQLAVRIEKLTDGDVTVDGWDVIR